MSSHDDFQTAYRNLENRMRRLAEEDGDIFLPNPEPSGPTQYVFVCMEPSLGGRSPEEARARVEAGGRNFLNSIEDFLLHFCARRYLCGQGQRYHITDISKGAMPVEWAGPSRRERYGRWHPLLLEELELAAAEDAELFALGNAAHEHLRENDIPWTFQKILHYSPQAARARLEGVKGHEERFENFRQHVSLSDVLDLAEKILDESQVPPGICEETLARLKNRELTPSRKKLMFSYKLAFEGT